MSKYETGKNRDEVEELLRAAQDELLLKLSLDSHLASASSSTLSSVDLDADLERRFQALKSSQSSVGIASEVRESKPALGDDLFARFDTLKVKSNPSLKKIPVVPSIEEDDENEDDQVEKLIQWAKDAARLDPSTPSDDDDNDEDREQQNQDRMKRK
ncbi:hypothetical protein QN277_028943 [Acacia crassicarpa]|uniref:Uncharacterized protein n=1 Tax=Acacia crassicarpa TaxID=499986 RepID=A0AAE1J8H1_9FABA|nr:hypothetical protein QN277_028943 [Acacia crassicarpa]